MTLPASATSATAVCITSVITSVVVVTTSNTRMPQWETRRSSSFQESFAKNATAHKKTAKALKSLKQTKDWL